MVSHHWLYFERQLCYFSLFFSKEADQVSRYYHHCYNYCYFRKVNSYQFKVGIGTSFAFTSGKGCFGMHLFVTDYSLVTLVAAVRGLFSFNASLTVLGLRLYYG